MGAVTVANVTPVSTASGRRAVQADVTFSSSYATGGDTIVPAQLGLQHIYEAYVLGGMQADSQQVPSKKYTPNSHGVQIVLVGTIAAPMLKAFSGATTEVANATNLSTRGAVNIEFRGV